MSRCALPKHLQDKKHNDWPWPLSKIPRHFNAKGPRCGVGKSGYLPWPPKLTVGHSVARWETSKSTSIIEIPALKDEDVDASIYGRTFTAIERKPGHPSEGQAFEITLEHGIVTVVGDEVVGRDYYSPSAIQYFSKKGWMELEPYYLSSWNWFLKHDASDSKGFFYRIGWRPDHLDVYFNWGPFLGLKGE